MTTLTKEQKESIMRLLHREFSELEHWNRRDENHPQRLPALIDARKSDAEKFRAIYKSIEKSAAIMLLDEPSFSD